MKYIMVHRVVIKAIIKNIVVVGGRDDIKLARNLRNSIKSAVFTRGAVETIRGNRAV